MKEIIFVRAFLYSPVICGVIALLVVACDPETSPTATPIPPTSGGTTSAPSSVTREATQQAASQPTPTSGETIQTMVDSVGDVGFSEEHWTLTAIGAGDVYLIGESPSIVLSPEGLPVISYTAETGETDPREPEQALFGPKLIVCGDPACSKHTAIMLGTTGFDSGSVLAVGNDSLPLILYRVYNEDMEDLILLKCGDYFCSEHTVATIDRAYFWSPGSVGIGADNLPVIAYQNVMDNQLKVAKCSNPACSADNTISTIEGLADPDGTNWTLNSVAIAMPPDGLPVITTYATNGKLKVTKCGDTLCSGSTVTTVDKGGLDDDTSSMTIGPDGLPVIAYYHDGKMKLVRCENPSCSENTIATVDSALAGFIASVTPSVAVGSDGHALVAYWSAGKGPPAGDLKIAKCENRSCSDSIVTTMTGVGTFALAIGADGLPVIIYYRHLPTEEGRPWLSGDPVDLVTAKCQDDLCVSR